MLHVVSGPPGSSQLMEQFSPHQVRGYISLESLLMSSPLIGFASDTGPLSPHTLGASLQPAGLGFLQTLSTAHLSHFHSVVPCKEESRTHTEIHLIQAHTRTGTGRTSAPPVFSPAPLASGPPFFQDTEDISVTACRRLSGVRRR